MVSATNIEPRRILVIGGSYAGLAATVNLLDLCNGKPSRFAGSSGEFSTPRRKIPIKVTIVDERDGFYHLIGSPLALASEDYAARVWRKFADIPALQTPEVSCIQGSVTSVDCASKLATVREAGSQGPLEVRYDYLITGSGLRRLWPTVPQSLSRAEYLFEVKKHIEKVKSARDGVVVIGGGAVGIEMAAELKLVQPELKVTLIHSRAKLLSAEPLPDEFKDCSLVLLEDAGVETILNTRVTKTIPIVGSSEVMLELGDGRQITAGHVISAISRFTPTSSYLPGAAVDDEGYVKIHPSLSFSGDIPNAEYHFAAGDIARWSGIKRCGAAMHHGHYTAVNIHQRLLHELDGAVPKLLELQEVPPMLGLAVGKKAASYGPLVGVQSGAEVMERMFRDDLGFAICWDYMRLGEKAVVEKA